MKDARTVRPYQSSGECPHGNCFISEITLTEKNQLILRIKLLFLVILEIRGDKKAPQGIREITLIIKTPAYHEDLRVSVGQVKIPCDSWRERCCR